MEHGGCIQTENEDEAQEKQEHLRLDMEKDLKRLKKGCQI